MTHGTVVWFKATGMPVGAILWSLGFGTWIAVDPQSDYAWALVALHVLLIALNSWLLVREVKRQRELANWARNRDDLGDDPHSRALARVSAALYNVTMAMPHKMFKQIEAYDNAHPGVSLWDIDPLDLPPFILQHRMRVYAELSRLEAAGSDET